MSTKIIVAGGRDARVAAIASCQRGRVNRRQLLAAGLTSAQIQGMLRSGRLLRLHAGVYAVGHAAPAPLGDETAALLAVRDGALLSNFTAIALWELAPPGVAWPEEVDVLVGLPWAGRRRGVRIHRTRLLTTRDRRVHLGLPVTSPARTLLDVACDLDERALERAHDQAILARVMRAADVAEVLTRTAGHPGHRRLQALHVAQQDPTFTRSEAEERLLDIVRRADLPQPLVNARVHGYEVDFYWPAQRLVVEVDGFRFHSGRAAFERDRSRDGRLHDHDVEVMRVTWRQLEHEPLALIARLARALARRTTGAVAAAAADMPVIAPNEEAPARDCPGATGAPGAADLDPRRRRPPV